ncbi:EAL domain-containing protein [Methylomonas sp. AM2-LC]|uniref:sensor domain-containing protein n=1 Tax=Methylomonas sp. AM2-LC TaxID=3153301 RepID=UPI003265E8BA
MNKRDFPPVQQGKILPENSDLQIEETDATQLSIRDALRVSESRYRRLFETAQDGILLLNAVSAQIEDVNPFLINMLGYSHQEFLGKKLWEVGAFADIAQSKEMFAALQNEGYVRYDNLPLKTRAGKRMQVEFVSNSYDCDGIKVIQCNIRDISERSELDGKVQRHTQLYAALSQCNKAIVHCKNKEDLFLQICQAAVDFGGMHMAFIGLLDEQTTCLHSVVSISDSAANLSAIETSLVTDSQYGHAPINTAVQEKRPVWCQDFAHDPLMLPWRELSEQRKWAASASLPLFNNQIVIGAFVLFSSEVNAFDEAARNLLIEMSGDIGFALDNLNREIQRKQAEDEIEHLAYYDALTSLPNRRLLHNRLQQRLLNLALHEHYGAVLMLDLDNFKNLNDTMGHNFGDLLLIEVALRLKACVSAIDTVARLGGDEFIVVLTELHAISAQAANESEVIANRILAALSEPYWLNGYQYHGSASIGITLFINHDAIEAELLKRTDTAMYQAKGSGGNAWRFYDPAMQAALEARTVLTRDLRCALAENQFSLYYQMQVDQHQTIFAAEALLRWQHPLRGLVLPGDFIPLAEEMGLIKQIGHWVLETACMQLKCWETNPLLCDLKLAVNVSTRQFYQPDFVEQVKSVLEKISIDPKMLKLEVTESVVMDDIDDTIFKMHALRECGVHFSLDDFGTGYSSLSYLTQLPLDQFKIDRSFVHNIGLRQEDAVIVQTIIGMAHNLGMDVIAEGVETEAQRSFLELHGCWRYQGYLFSRPVPISEFEKSVNLSGCKHIHNRIDILAEFN